MDRHLPTRPAANDDSNGGVATQRRVGPDRARSSHCIRDRPVTPDASPIESRQIGVIVTEVQDNDATPSAIAPSNGAEQPLSTPTSVSRSIQNGTYLLMLVWIVVVASPVRRSA
jgi:hypothetical protein